MKSVIRNLSCVLLFYGITIKCLKMGNNSKKIVKKRIRLRAQREHVKNIRERKRTEQTDDDNSASTLTLLTTVKPTVEQNELVEIPPLQTTMELDLPNQEPLPYTIEEETQDLDRKPQGRRIIDIMYFTKELQKISNHSSMFNCTLNDMTLIGEKRSGLICKFKFRCNMCNQSFIASSENPENDENIDANMAAVTGITSTGIGYSQFQEITACLNVPVFTETVYRKIQDAVYEKWEETAAESMEEAAIRERDAAIAEGRISKDGIPIIDVLADACWSSRSYGNNFKALSGAAAIVGRKFGEVLYIGVKNKYCVVCARAEKTQNSKPEHVCFKNYTGSSSGMESEIICQGFEKSIETYNIMYGRMIADGDSATYAKILASNPYPNYTVQKIECRNHIMRNMCNKLRALTKETKYPLEFRKTLTNIKIMSIRKVIIASIQKYKYEKDIPESITIFRNEVQNSVYHAYGNHEHCKDYYCLKEKTAQTNMDIERNIFWLRVKTIVGSVLSKWRSLLEDVDTNVVERFNSIVAKFVGGKRINFSLRRGYSARCSAAVVSFNNPHPSHTLQKKILGNSPKGILKSIEARRLRKRKINLANPHKKNRSLTKISKTQHDYGAQSTTPDMPPEELERAKDLFLQNLKELTSDKEKIQQSTINQRDNHSWLELRKNMITASNFGIVIKRRENSSKAKLVENILYKSNLGNIAAIAHGVENEQLALKQLALQEKVIIVPCGLYVDHEYPYVGASPDGLIGHDTIVEVKCPIVAFKNGLDNAITLNKIQIWKYDIKKNLILNKRSNWHYQIQGQLHVTQKKKCLFAVWSGENTPLKTSIIEKDDHFWENNMKEKITKFYTDWLLPEIVDSRKMRGMPLRENESNKSETEQTGIQPRQLNFDILPINQPCSSRQLTFDEI